MRDKYQKRIKQYSRRIETLQSIMDRLVKAKIAIIIIAIILLVISYEIEQLLVGSVFTVIAGVVFVVLQTRHKKIMDFNADLSKLREINKKGLARTNGQWRSFEDDGSDFVSKDHPYGEDLDIVGKDSLFQWINMCETPWGRQALAHKLLYPTLNTESIRSKQEAISELSRRNKFRLRLALEASKLKADKINLDRLIAWTKDTHDFYEQKWFKIVISILPVITLLAITFGYLLNVISAIVPTILLIIHIGLLRMGSIKRNHYLNSINGVYRSLKGFARLFKLVESHEFRSDSLNLLKANLVSEDKKLASISLKKLSNIASMVSMRNNMFYFLINVLFLWDYHCCYSLESWKTISGRHMEDWFKTIGEFESLSSIALINYEHDSWVMPEFNASEDYIYAESLGHPLIHDGCITNDISFNKNRSIGLITGSNMSGKSTFLRTLGVNLILAYVGAPVRASVYHCQLMGVHTCMRISDDLQNNISSFYGEILRVKMIIEALKSEEQVFFLLDEIFKGTNSMDRHTAAKAVIHQLEKEGAVGLVSTHDLELDVIEAESEGRVKNYHFEEHYDNEKIEFDYLLREGVSTTRNAIYLIKAAGIKM